METRGLDWAPATRRAGRAWWRSCSSRPAGRRLSGSIRQTRRVFGLDGENATLPSGVYMSFHDKIVLVTGGTGGLGREVTLAFLEAGASVMVTYRRAEEFAAVVTSAGRIGVKPPDGAAVDVTDFAAVEGFVASVMKRHGRIDIL